MSTRPDASRFDGGSERTRREWLLLGERIFSHPRYAVIIVAALGLCAIERYPVVLASLALFFTVELGLRFWLQKERGFGNRMELGFLVLDTIATLSLLLAVFQPSGLALDGMYLRLARLLRGMYMLRMLRIFRFLTYETLIYSRSFTVAVLLLALLGVLIPDIALVAGVVLMIEAACRGYAVVCTLEQAGRRRIEAGFAVFDFLSSLALLGLADWLAPAWALLRFVRFIVMLNPLGNLWTALLKVGMRDEVRKESAMLAGVFALLMGLTSLAVLYLYPRMDLSDNEAIGASDYAPWQVILFSFRILLDPGTAPADAFSPLLAIVTMLIVLSGVFFFALFVGLGSNVMHYLLEQLANSPLSARESLLVAGWSRQAIPVLRVFDQLCARMRRSVASAWIFFGPVGAGARGIGRWLPVRQVEPGERGVMRRFNLSGVRFSFLFQPRFADWRDRAAVADMHALVREGGCARPEDDSRGVVICDAALPQDIRAVYSDSLGMEVLDSAGLKARMLYQMHHCAHMPELGVRMLDVVNGEPGLYAVACGATLHPDTGGTIIEHAGERVLLADWLSHCFEKGINLLAARMPDGDFRLLGDMGDLDAPQEISDVVGIGRDPLLWVSTLRSAMEPPAENPAGSILRDFTWAETWDISMIFLGWHDGLPAMVEEMAERHHKLTLHVLFPGDETTRTLRRERLNESMDRATERTGCKVETHVHPWYGFSAEAMLPHLKGCKVVMLYPEDAGGGEDSLLEMWFHETARMLDARKARVKWWTPPKLMVLPRDSAQVGELRRAARDYAHLDIHIGSPDSFHDVFMARQLLSRALHHARPEQLRQDKVAFDFMQVVLGDAVIIDDVEVTRLFAEADGSWTQVQREACRRGWMLIGYLLPSAGERFSNLFHALDTLFPLERVESGSRMHLLGGSPPESMDAPHHASSLLFCRRGVLREKPVASPVVPPEESAQELAEKQPSVGTVEDAKAKESRVSADKQEDTEHSSADDTSSGTEIAAESSQEEPLQDMAVEAADAVAEPAPEVSVAEEGRHDDAETVNKGCAVSAVDDTHTAGSREGTLAEIAKEGEVMQSSVWPESADKRLLTILRKQVEGALELLNASTEDGLVKLTDAMDRDVEGVLADDIMAALTDFQNIDRVMQRLRNVESCLNDWSSAVASTGNGKALWKDEVEKRYVMEEERQVLRSEL